MRWSAYKVDEGLVEVGYAVPENVAVGCLKEECSLADAELFGQKNGVSRDVDSSF